MPIVAGAILPHSPLLVQNVAQDHFQLLEKSVEATRTIIKSLYAAQPDAVIILTPHGETDPDSLCIASAERYHGGFLSFGDPHTNVEARGALGIVHQMRQSAEHHHIPLQLRSPAELDYGASVPTLYLNEAWSPATIIPLAVPARQSELCIRAGAWLYDFCQSQSWRLAIIGSVDGSRRRKDTDAVRRPTSEERRWSSAITVVDPSMLPTDTPSTSCAEPVLRLLLTALQSMTSQGTISSFEAPYGVGLFTAWFTVST